MLLANIQHIESVNEIRTEMANYPTSGRLGQSMLTHSTDIAWTMHEE